MSVAEIVFSLYKPKFLRKSYLIKIKLLSFQNFVNKNAFLDLFKKKND